MVNIKSKTSIAVMPKRIDLIKTMVNNKSNMSIAVMPKRIEALTPKRVRKQAAT